MTDREQFEKDHAPGNRVLTASRWPGLVLAPDDRPEWVPGPLALALHMRGEVPLEAEGKQLRLGHLMEGPAERMLAEDHDIGIMQRQPRFERADIPALCYPDAVAAIGGAVDEASLVEVKTVIGGERAYEERWGAGPPLHVKAQAQAQMLISGVPICLIVPVIIGFADIRCEVIEEPVDEQIQALLLSEARTFFEILDAGELPAPDASESSYRALLRSTNIDPDARVELDDMESLRRAERWRQARLDRLAAQKVEDAEQYWFAARAGDATWIELADGSKIKRTFVKGRTETKPREIAPSWRWYPEGTKS